VLIDSTVVRMMLMPALMEIPGDANWWFPKWLGWLPRLLIDAAPPAEPSRAEVEPTPEAVPAGV
jgi:RND superfamily putative drug exporter